MSGTQQSLADRVQTLFLFCYNKAMQPLADLLRRRVGKGTFAWQVQAALVVEAVKKVLTQVLGADLAREVKVLYYREQKIFLATPEPDLATELKLKKFQIMERIKKTTEAEIKDLVVWVR